MMWAVASMFWLLVCLLQVEGEGIDGEVVKLVVPGVAEIKRIVEINCQRDIDLRGLQAN